MKWPRITEIVTVKMIFKGGNSTIIDAYSFNVTSDSAGKIEEIKWSIPLYNKVLNIDIKHVVMVHVVGRRRTIVWR